MSEPPVLVIGAGPAGLAAAAAFQRQGLPFRLVDAGRGPGGIWDIGRDRTPMYESAHFISSRTLSGFPGFPMPDDYPDYPRHDRILAYIESFAHAHGLAERVEAGVEVVDARRDPAGGWRVTDREGRESRHRALCVATGLAWHPRLPDVPGRFDGEAYHAFDYRSADGFRGKRVLVVGGGNSGCDIACDAARTAARAFISLRRGYRFVPKWVMGKPSDVFAESGPRLPAPLERRVFEFLLDRVLVGDLTRYGLSAPDHAVLTSHPIMNTQILHHLGHGDLEARPDVKALRGDVVEFADGTVEAVDVIVYATGYRRIFPFLESGCDGVDAPLDLYLNVFHRDHPDLAYLGLFETDGAAYGLLGRQAELVARAWSLGEGEGARAFDQRRRSARPDLRGGRRYLDSERHAYYVKRSVYRRRLEDELEHLRQDHRSAP